MTDCTPGPWNYEERFDEGGTSLGIGVYAKREEVARLPGIGENDFANANLIANAPAMLAALQEIIAMTAEDNGTFRKRGGTYRGLVSVIAQDAVAKVTGEPFKRYDS